MSGNKLYNLQTWFCDSLTFVVISKSQLIAVLSHCELGLNSWENNFQFLQDHTGIATSHPT